MQATFGQDDHHFLHPCRPFKRVSRSVVSYLLLSVVAMSGIRNTPAQITSTNQGSASTGAAVTPILDKKHRPITAGGFVASGPAHFQDVSKRSGLASWTHRQGSSSKEFILDTDGSGVALLDYDKDGWLDIYLVNGSTMAAEQGREPAPQAALFHNNHDGTFTNVAFSAGVTNERWGFGAAIGDFDNDGWPDIYVTNFGKNRLYRNNHNGTFTDVAARAGVEVGGWSTGATFGDYDGDGLLDLFVPGYVAFDLQHPPVAGTATTSFHTCQFRSVPVSCGPRGLQGASDHLFHNNGDGTFTDVSERAGVADPQLFFGFGGLFVDVNGDGRPDLLVANDSTPNYLYINQGDGTFKEEGVARGFAYNKGGREVASMGLAAGDYLNSGSMDLAITNFSDDYKLVFENDGHGNFTDVSEQVGLSQNTSPFLGWGVGFLDYDNDGWIDLMMFNGHVYPIVDAMPWGTTYRQRPLLFHNRKGKGFDLISPVENSGLAVVASARGAAFGDLFNDGRVDVVVNNLDGTPTLLRNVSKDQHRWLEISLIGGARSPRDAVGATVFLETGGNRQRQDVLSGGSFLSSNDFRLHFGLGDSGDDSQLTIQWPDGQNDRLRLPEQNVIYTIEQGHGIVAKTRAIGVTPTSSAHGAENSVARPPRSAGYPHAR
jgi:enediyne biosynthesis protein E4